MRVCTYGCGFDCDVVIFCFNVRFIMHLEFLLKMRPDCSMRNVEFNFPSLIIVVDVEVTRSHFIGMVLGGIFRPSALRNFLRFERMTSLAVSRATEHSPTEKTLVTQLQISS